MSETKLPVIAAIANAPTGFVLQEMVINQKVDGKYKPVGTVQYVLPTLAAFGISAEVAGTDQETGWPEYKTDEHTWLQAAIDSAVKAMVRNRIDNATASLKPGATIPVSLAEITAEGERSGAALKVISEAKKDFAAWVAGLGKTQAACALLTQLFASKQAISLRPAGDKAKFAAYLSDFAGQLPEDKLAAYERYLDSLVQATQTELEATDF